jgi:hypothetical protein
MIKKGKGINIIFTKTLAGIFALQRIKKAIDIITNMYNPKELKTKHAIKDKRDKQVFSIG